MLGEFEPEDFVVRTEKFGVPQARHRIIILGIRSDIKRTPGSLIASAGPSIDEVIRDLPRLRSGLSKEEDSSKAWSEAVRGIVDEKWFLNGSLQDDMRQALTVAIHRISEDLQRGGEYCSSNRRPGCLPEWYFDPKLGGVLNPATRGHISQDLYRYLFASVYAEAHGHGPLLQDFPKPLCQNIRMFARH